MWEGIEFVAIGQGNAVHAAYVYKSFHGTERLGAKCDRTGFASAGTGRKVRPVVVYPNREVKVTCRSCIKIMEKES